MADEENDDLERASRRTKRGVFSGERILMLFLLVLGLIVGMTIEHQFIEPILGNAALDRLNECVQSKNLLNQELDACYRELNAEPDATTNP